MHHINDHRLTSIISTLRRDNYRVKVITIRKTSKYSYDISLFNKKSNHIVTAVLESMVDKLLQHPV